MVFSILCAPCCWSRCRLGLVLVTTSSESSWSKSKAGVHETLDKQLNLKKTSFKKLHFITFGCCLNVFSQFNLFHLQLNNQSDDLLKGFWDLERWNDQMKWLKTSKQRDNGDKVPVCCDQNRTDSTTSADQSLSPESCSAQNLFSE